MVNSEAATAANDVILIACTCPPTETSRYRVRRNTVVSIQVAFKRAERSNGLGVDEDCLAIDEKRNCRRGDVLRIAEHYKVPRDPCWLNRNSHGVKCKKPNPDDK